MNPENGNINNSPEMKPVDPELVFRELADQMEVKMMEDETPSQIRKTFEAHQPVKFTITIDYGLFVSAVSHFKISQHINESERIGIQGNVLKNIKGETMLTLYSSDTPMPKELEKYISIIGREPFKELIKHKLRTSLGIKLG